MVEGSVSHLTNHLGYPSHRMSFTRQSITYPCRPILSSNWMRKKGFGFVASHHQRFQCIVEAITINQTFILKVNSSLSCKHVIKPYNRDLSCLLVACRMRHVQAAACPTVFAPRSVRAVGFAMCVHHRLAGKQWSAKISWNFGHLTGLDFSIVPALNGRMDLPHALLDRNLAPSRTSLNHTVNELVQEGLTAVASSMRSLRPAHQKAA